MKRYLPIVVVILVAVEALSHDLSEIDKRNAEHQRLKDALVEAAKEFRKTSDDFEPSGAYGHRRKPWYDLIAEIDKLIQFDSKQ